MRVWKSSGNKDMSSSGRLLASLPDGLLSMGHSPDRLLQGFGKMDDGQPMGGGILRVLCLQIVRHVFHHLIWHDKLISSQGVHFYRRILMYAPNCKTSLVASSSATPGSAEGRHISSCSLRILLFICSRHFRLNDLKLYMNRGSSSSCLWL